MPIIYNVRLDGHFIDAVASGTVTDDECVRYEVAHAIDERIKPPVSELLRIEYGAFDQVTKDGILRTLEHRKNAPRAATPHRCAITVEHGDAHAWNLAKLYEGLVILHYPESVIVFGDVNLAKMWLGVEEVTTS